MGGPVSVSDAGIALIAEFEGFRPTLYNCVAGHCTIGYGHLVHRGATGTDAEAESPFRDGISEVRAREMLRVDADVATAALEEHVTAPLTQTQVDALTSLVFNIGVPAFAKSTLLKHLNARRYTQAAHEFDRWVMAGPRTVNGLVTRRHKERALFERGR